MATGDIAARNSAGGLDTLTQILQTLKGGPKTTTTSGEVVSQDKANALLQQILESTGGLAAVSGGQKGAGLYNSSTNRLLTNDLLARSTANVAALSSQKTQTTQVGAQPGALGSAVSLLGSSLLKPTITAGLKKAGIDVGGFKTPGDYIADAIFGPSTPGLTSGATSGFSAIGSDAGLGIAAPVSNTAALQSLDFLGSSGGNAASAAGGVLGGESLGGLFAVDAGTAGSSLGAASSLTDLGFLQGIGGAAAGSSAAGTAAGTLATDVDEHGSRPGGRVRPRQLTAARDDVRGTWRRRLRGDDRCRKRPGRRHERQPLQGEETLQHACLRLRPQHPPETAPPDHSGNRLGIHRD